jgi:glycosyltransferase involved in cell wall biosynthesis
MKNSCLMKLALCLEYPIGLRGGVSVLVETLLVELNQQGHEIVLVSEDTPESFHAHPSSSLACQFIPWNPQRPSRAYARHLARQLAEANVELAHFHHGGNFGWGNRFPFRSPLLHLDRMGIPCVSTAHLVVDIFTGYCGPKKPRWFKALMLPMVWWGKMQQLRHTRFEIAVSQHDFNKLRRWYRPLRTRFVQIYHSRLRGENVPPASAATRQPAILNVGHLAWRKGQAVLAEAFAQIADHNPEWRLEFAGPDVGEGAAERIKQIAKTHRLETRILLLGARDDASDLMQRSAIYVQPSFWEALGLALQEAMFWGCPAIGSRAGGIPELIEEGRTGLLFESGNVRQLADALQRLIRDPTARTRLGEAAAGSIREKGMTVEVMVARHLRLYEEVLGPVRRLRPRNPTKTRPP